MSVYICCGSDKGFVFAISFDCETQKFSDQFIDTEAHMSPVTSVICDKKCLISAGNDGSIQSYSLDSKRKLSAFDNLHNSGIRSLSFSNDQKFLFTTDDAGLIIIWKKSGSIWESSRVINKHKKSVIMSIHPSDKFALSISKDNTFRVWNLYNGLQSHKMQIREQYSNVRISPKGTYYILCTFNVVNVYEIAEASLKCSIKTSGCIKDVLFIDDTKLCIAETKKITIYSFSDTLKEISSLNNENLVCKHVSFTQSEKNGYLACVMVSNLESCVHVYDVSLLEENKKDVSLLGTHELSNLRITSMYCLYK